MLTEVKRLIDVYYDLISMDHHKTKDTYFSIETVIRPYEEVQYRACHSGYISEIGNYGVGPDRANYDEALADLAFEVKAFISNQLDLYNRQLAEPAEWDAEDIDLANKRIAILTNAGFDWLQLKGN
jgi:predicted ABC-class ATPase